MTINYQNLQAQMILALQQTQPVADMSTYKLTAIEQHDAEVATRAIVKTMVSVSGVESINDTVCRNMCINLVLDAIARAKTSAQLTDGTVDFVLFTELFDTFINNGIHPIMDDIKEMNEETV